MSCKEHALTVGAALFVGFAIGGIRSTPLLRSQEQHEVGSESPVEIRRTPDGRPAIPAKSSLASLGKLLDTAAPPGGSKAIAANERYAVATLSALVVAQEEFRAAAAVDTDRDGLGEYGFFGELTGMSALRVPDPVSGGVSAGDPERDRLDVPFLAPKLGKVVPDSRGEGIIETNGYCFKLFLPAASAAGAPVRALAEAPDGGARSGDLASGRWGSDQAELMWCAYAWPIEAGQTGQRIFFVNQRGQILESTPTVAGYSGREAPPTFQVAFDAAQSPSLDAGLGRHDEGRVSHDGNEWIALRG